MGYLVPSDRRGRIRELVFVAGDMQQLSTKALEAEVARRYSRISAEMCEWLLLVAELDRREAHLKWDCHTCAHWLSWHCGVAIRAAQDHVRVARRLGELPLITAAFARGELSYSKVRALTRIAEPETEERVLDAALNATASQLERIASAYRRATTAPEPAGLLERRYASFHWDDDGCLELRARLTPEEGALVMKALDGARDDVFHELSDDAVAAERRDGQPIREARTTNADALVRLAENGLAGAQARASGGDATQVVVHVDAAELAEPGEHEGADQGASEGRCELDNGPGIHTTTARRLACDAAIVTLVERDGEPLSVGRKTRTVPPAIRRALRSRDRGCRFPGCSAERFVDAHHIRHWADGGKTELSNLIQLCRRHHRLIHEGEIDVEARADGTFVFLKRGRELPESPRLPGADLPARPLAAIAADAPTDGERLCKPLGGCAPRNGRQPLDLELTTWCLCRAHDRARAGPAP